MNVKNDSKLKMDRFSKDTNPREDLVDPRPFTGCDQNDS